MVWGFLGLGFRVRTPDLGFWGFRVLFRFLGDLGV